MSYSIYKQSRSDKQIIYIIHIIAAFCLLFFATNNGPDKWNFSSDNLFEFFSNILIGFIFSTIPAFIERIKISNLNKKVQELLIQDTGGWFKWWWKNTFFYGLIFIDFIIIGWSIIVLIVSLLI